MIYAYYSHDKYIYSRLLQRKFGATPSPMTAQQSMSDNNSVSATFTEKDESNQIKSLTENKNLSDFFKLYNSEDNDSFEKLHAKDEEERRRRLHWLYDDDVTDANGERRRAGMLMWYFAGGKHLTQAERARVDRLLLSDAELEDEDREGGNTRRPSQVDTWKFRVRNQLMFPPDLQSSRDICALQSSSTSTLGNQHAPEFVARPATKQLEAGETSLLVENGHGANEYSEGGRRETSLVMHSDSSSRNVSCSSNENSLQVERGKLCVVPSSGIGAKSSVHAKIVKPTNESKPVLSVLDNNESYSTYFSHLDDDQKIIYRNTRLKGSFLQDREKRDKVLSDQMTPLHRHNMSTPSSVLSAPLEEPHTPSVASTAGEDEWESDTLTRNYRPVAMTPSPLPASLFTENSDDPLLTWGTIVGTPMILDPKLSDMVDDAKQTKKRQLAVADGIDTEASGRYNRYRGGVTADPHKPFPALDINTSTLSDTFEIQGSSSRETLLHSMVPTAGLLAKGKSFLSSSSTVSSSKKRRTSHPSGKYLSNGSRHSKTLTPAAQALATKLATPSSLNARFSNPSNRPVRKEGRSAQIRGAVDASPFTGYMTSGNTPSVEMSLRQSYNSKGSDYRGNDRENTTSRRSHTISIVGGGTAKHESKRKTHDRSTGNAGGGTDDLLKLD